MDIKDVLREMQEAVHIGRGVDPMSVDIWMLTIEAAMRDKDEELEFLRSVKERRGKELDEKEAEIGRLKDKLKIAEGWLQETEAKNERLKQERDNARSLLEAAIREGVIGQALADIERLEKVLQRIDDLICWEINPSNYDHEEVCKMNAEWCEVGDLTRAALDEKGVSHE